MFGFEAPLALAPLSTLAPTLDHPTAEVMPVGIHELALVLEPAAAPGLGRRLVNWRTGFEGGIEAFAGVRLPGAPLPANAVPTTQAGVHLGGAWSVIPGLYKLQADLVAGTTGQPALEDWRLWQVLELVTPWGTPRLAQGWLAGNLRALAAYDMTLLPGLVGCANVAWQPGPSAGWSTALGARWRLVGDLALSATAQVGQAREASVAGGVGCRL